MHIYTQGGKDGAQLHAKTMHLRYTLNKNLMLIINNDLYGNNINGTVTCSKMTMEFHIIPTTQFS